MADGVWIIVGCILVIFSNLLGLFVDWCLSAVWRLDKSIDEGR